MLQLGEEGRPTAIRTECWLRLGAAASRRVRLSLICYACQFAIRWTSTLAINDCSESDPTSHRYIPSPATSLMHVASCPIVAALFSLFVCLLNTKQTFAL